VIASSKMSVNRLRLEAFRFLCRQLQVKMWMEKIIGSPFPKDREFHEFLKDGVSTLLTCAIDTVL
jgi:hypothetical protein